MISYRTQINETNASNIHSVHCLINRVVSFNCILDSPIANGTCFQCDSSKKCCNEMNVLVNQSTDRQPPLRPPLPVYLFIIIYYYSYGMPCKLQTWNQMYDKNWLWLNRTVADIIWMTRCTRKASAKQQSKCVLQPYTTYIERNSLAEMLHIQYTTLNLIHFIWVSASFELNGEQQQRKYGYVPHVLNLTLRELAATAVFTSHVL